MSVDAVLIAGPTASGKSAAALMLAERFRGALINADSMQVYNNLRILTARPTPEEERRAPHYLYGHVDIRSPYSAGRYQDDAAAALREVQAKNLLPIFVGGTGLYFGVLTNGLSPMPAVPAEVRARVRQHHQEIGGAAFHAELARNDPAAAAMVLASDAQRLTRAAEIWEATGRSIRDWQEKKGHPVLENMRLARFVIMPPRDVLYARIDARFDRMMAEGALEEVRALGPLDPALPAAKALGIPSLVRALADETSLETALDDAKRQTRQYAKRQLSWFRQRQKDWIWLESQDFGNIITQISCFLS